MNNTTARAVSKRLAGNLTETDFADAIRALRLPAELVTAPRDRLRYRMQEDGLP